MTAACPLPVRRLFHRSGGTSPAATAPVTGMTTGRPAAGQVQQYDAAVSPAGALDDITLTSTGYRRPDGKGGHPAPGDAPHKCSGQPWTPHGLPTSRVCHDASDHSKPAALTERRTTALRCGTVL